MAGAGWLALPSADDAQRWRWLAGAAGGGGAWLAGRRWLRSAGWLGLAVWRCLALPGAWRWLGLVGWLPPANWVAGAHGAAGAVPMRSSRRTAWPKPKGPTEPTGRRGICCIPQVGGTGHARGGRRSAWGRRWPELVGSWPTHGERGAQGEAGAPARKCGRRQPQTPTPRPQGRWCLPDPWHLCRHRHPPARIILRVLEAPPPTLCILPGAEHHRARSPRRMGAAHK